MISIRLTMHTLRHLLLTAAAALLVATAFGQTTAHEYYFTKRNAANSANQQVKVTPESGKGLKFNGSLEPITFTVGTLASQDTVTASQITDTTAFTRTFLAAADAAAARTQLGLGTLATQSGTFSGTHSGNTSGTNTGDQTITLSGDGSGTGTGAITLTLATVNSNPGTHGSSSAIPVLTLDTKGRATAATTAPVVAPAGTLTGTTLAANVVTSSLTGTGTLTSGATGSGFTLNLDASTLTGTLPIANGGTGGTTQATALAGLGALFSAVETKTGNYTVAAADRGKLIQFNGSSSATFTLPSASSVGAGFAVAFSHVGEGGYLSFNTLSGNQDLGRGSSAIVVSDGTAWRFLRQLATDPWGQPVLAAPGLPAGGPGSIVQTSDGFIYILGYNGETMLSSEENLIRDPNGFASLNFSDRTLHDSSGYAVLRWTDSGLQWWNNAHGAWSAIMAIEEGFLLYSGTGTGRGYLYVATPENGESVQVHLNMAGITDSRSFVYPDVTGTLGVRVSAIPSTPTSAGAVGSWAADSTHLYICTETNTWRRVALSTW